MTQDEARAFATGWIDAWNRRDLAAVLAHYSDDIRFFSPIAETVAGKPCLEGKAALAAYWERALEKYASLCFTMEEFAYSPERDLLAIYYVADLNGQRRMVCESQWFDGAGLVGRAAAYYGAVL